MTDNFEFHDSPDVEGHAATLGCQIPTDIALLPRNFFIVSTKDELCHEQDATTFRSLLRQAQIKETTLEADGERFPDIVEHGFVEFVAPTLFVSFAAISLNPQLLAVALGVFSNYISDFFKGRLDNNVAHLNIIVKTKSRTYRRISYRGPVNGIDSLPKIISSIVYDSGEDEINNGDNIV